MEAGQFRRGQSIATKVTREHRATMRVDHPAAWDRHVYQGVAIPGISAGVRGAMVKALGEIGTEAEFFLALTRSVLPPGSSARSLCEVFLRQVEMSSTRLFHIANAVEIATQSFLAELERVFPELRDSPDVPVTWWPQPFMHQEPGEPLELRLRRCGYAYRHVVEVQLGVHVEAIVDQMALVLHALLTLPPAGVLPAHVLYSGLDALTAGLQGEMVPRHIVDASAEHGGILTAIARLRTLTAYEDTALEQDIAWAHGHYASAWETAQRLAREGTHFQATMHVHNEYSWVMRALKEWRETISQLERLRMEASGHRPRG